MVDKRKSKTIKAVKTPRKTPLQENKKKDTETLQKMDETPRNQSNTIQNIQESSSSIVDNDLQSKELQRIVKKKQYRQFVAMVRQGKFTSAMVTAKILGVSRPTIAEWLQTKKVQKAMQYDVNNYISKIQSSKDWKAQAYLLDKLEGTKEEEETKQELKQLIVINT